MPELYPQNAPNRNPAPLFSPIFSGKAEMKTVPIMIAQLRAADYSKFDLGKVYMFILLAILPVLLVYIFLSRYIVKGVTAGSVKG